MKLVIIEGAGKKETIEKYLGKGYRVFATKGHVRDLPVKSLGVSIAKNFEPSYTIMNDKKDIVEKLKTQAEKADEILLATDPDREGEAISWHLAHILKLPLDKKSRIVFNEISKTAVQKALDNPRTIDIKLVDAQQARRVLDRIVGYKMSPVLIKKIQAKLSAGRVQSVTLKLVVDREREIIAFKPEEYWTFFSLLEQQDNNKPMGFKAELIKKDGKKFELFNKEEVDLVLQDIDNKVYTVSNVKKAVTLSKPYPPFTTPTMQQDALNKLGMSLKATSMAAQKLYEGVELGSQGKTALVTYIRTDSVRVSPDAQASAKEYILKKYGDKYVPEKPNFYASKKGSQDAHEAIRPIDITVTPDSVKQYLESSQYRLYKLIYERFLASQMTAAQYNSVTVDIDCDKYGFRAKGKTLLFDGYTIIYGANTDKKANKDNNEENTDNDNSIDKDEDKNDKDVILPELNVGDTPKFIKYDYTQKFTKPPARYTEASLVKAMEESGIGRPATYTPTISILYDRKYVEKDGKQIYPTKLGFDATDMLVKYFKEILTTEFTANMEDTLDEIEGGDKKWQEVVGKFWHFFEPQLKNALGDEYTMKEPPIDTDIVCELCGAKMQVKMSRFNKQFLSCSAYPKCKNAKDVIVDGDNITVVKKEPLPTTDELCDKCGKPLVYKNGRFGMFLACSGYPTCKNIIKEKSERKFEPLSFGEPLANCPQCGKELVAKKGKTGLFCGCSGYPDCKFVNKYPLVLKTCPKCASHFMLIKKASQKEYHCSNKECGHVDK